MSTAGTGVRTLTALSEEPSVVPRTQVFWLPQTVKVPQTQRHVKKLSPPSPKGEPAKAEG